VLKSSRLASHDDSFHEIQLNGKQLVFLFMVVIVVSSVIFLCGVLVGRGVRGERSAIAEAEALEQAPTADAVAASSSSAPPVESDPRAAAPPTAVNDLSYANRLERTTPPPEELKRESSAPSPARSKEVKSDAAAAPPAGRNAEVKPPAEPPPAASAPAAGTNWVVQVAALNVRGDAEARTKKLTARGYAAYVEPPAPATPNVFRVRVGPFKSQREAQTVADQIGREDNIKPWVTR
jgi:cell division septation protein DedD